MSRKLTEDLEAIYGGILCEDKQSMTVGNTKIGDLDGPTKKVGPTKSGTEKADIKKAEETEDDTTVADSIKEGKSASKFDELYKQVVEEADEISGIESGAYDKSIEDFPPEGGDTAEAENLEDELMEDEAEDLASLFRQFGEIATKIADAYEAEGVVDDGEVIDDGMEIGEDEDLSAEAVESTPAPNSTGTLTSKGNMKVSGVKVVKKTASSTSSGQEDGGKPKSAPGTNLGPTMKFKSNGSGAAVDGKGASAFE